MLEIKDDMINGYKNLFSEAVARTAKTAFALPDNDLNLIGSVRKKYLTDDNKKGIVKHLFRCLGNFQANYIDEHSIELNVKFKSYLEDYLDCPVVLTIGGVNHKGAAAFCCEEKDVEVLFNKTDPGFKKKKVHTWFTLPSFEIIDLTFLENQNNRRGLPFSTPDEYDYIFDNINNIYLKEQIIYMPMLVGIDSLIKLKLISSTSDKNNFMHTL